MICAPGGIPAQNEHQVYIESQDKLRTEMLLTVQILKAHLNDQAR